MTRKTEGGIAAETARIVLGDRIFTVRGFTLDQIQELLHLFDEASKPFDQGGWEVARKILVAALADQIAEAELLGLKVTLRQVAEAVRTVGLVSEIYRPGERGAPVDQPSP